MAASSDIDKLCEEFFGLCCEKVKTKKLPDSEKQRGTGAVSKKFVKEGCGVGDTGLMNSLDTNFAKLQDPKTKTISRGDFLNKLLPQLAADKAKVKDPSDPKAQAELAKLKDNVAKKLEEWKAADGKGKSGGVVGRLTDASGYTGAHKERFDKDGKGKGMDGRVDKTDNSGYVGNYKNADTFDKAKK